MTAAPAEPLTFDPYDCDFHEHLEPAPAEGGFDWIDDVAGELPMDVISELMGMPDPDRAEIRRPADLVVHDHTTTTTIADEVSY